jgi:hypothetical protein
MKLSSKFAKVNTEPATMTAAKTVSKDEQL